MQTETLQWEHPPELSSDLNLAFKTVTKATGTEQVRIVMLSSVSQKSSRRCLNLGVITNQRGCCLTRMLLHMEKRNTVKPKVQCSDVGIFCHHKIDELKKVEINRKPLRQNSSRNLNPGYSNMFLEETIILTQTGWIRPELMLGIKSGSMPGSEEYSKTAPFCQQEVKVNNSKP